jgi:hypothetical protein
MTTYEKIRAWIGPAGRSRFPELDENGDSAYSLGFDLPVRLYVDPAPDQGGEDPFYLYLPLLPLTGAGAEAERLFLRALAARNMPGALPAGYRLFLDPDGDEVYLGGQFRPDNLDGPAFDQLTERFVNCGLAVRESLTKLFQTLTASAEPQAAPPSAPWPEARPSDFMLRV